MRVVDYWPSGISSPFVPERSFFDWRRFSLIGRCCMGTAYHAPSFVPHAKVRRKRLVVSALWSSARLTPCGCHSFCASCRKRTASLANAQRRNEPIDIGRSGASRNTNIGQGD